MSVKTTLKNFIDKCNLYDFLIIVAGISLVCLSSPYVMRQFAHLTKGGDIFWNICWDVLLFDIGILCLLLLSKVVKALVTWLEKHI